MPKHDDKYTLFFAFMVTLVCAVILASAATLLKPIQQKNIALDKRKNILKAFGVEVASKTGEEINQLFLDRVEPRAITEGGDEISDLTDAQIEALDSEEEQKKPNPENRQHPLFILKGDGGQTEAFCIPIHGKGLWSTLYGYLALERDGNTVKGITYYQHGETPGLGAEVENPSWQAQFDGKKIYEGNALVSIAVVKGKDTSSNPHAVDSISGATITSNGVTNMLKSNLEIYADYIKQHAGR